MASPRACVIRLLAACHSAICSEWSFKLDAVGSRVSEQVAHECGTMPTPVPGPREGTAFPSDCPGNEGISQICDQHDDQSEHAFAITVRSEVLLWGSV